MANQFDGLAPTSELEAVNQLLSVIGEAAVTDLATATQGDVVMAIATFKENMREVQAMGWRCNSDFDYPIAQDDDNKFPVPTVANSDPGELARFKMTNRPDQLKPKMLKQLSDGAYAGDPQWLDIVQRGAFLYDRFQNKFDFGDATIRPYVFIDPVWILKFVELPETLRKFITVRAAQQFARNVVGIELGRTLDIDVHAAWVSVRKDQGLRVYHTIWQNYDVARVLRRRQHTPTNYA